MLHPPQKIRLNTRNLRATWGPLSFFLLFFFFCPSWVGVASPVSLDLFLGIQESHEKCV